MIIFEPEKTIKMKAGEVTMRLNRGETLSVWWRPDGKISYRKPEDDVCWVLEG